MSKTTKILIAEDDPFLSKIMSGQLKREGFEIDVARDGQEALDLIKKNEYKMILLDLVMPNKSGFDVLEELKADGNKTAVSVFTNLSQKEDEERVKELGAKHFFVKHDVTISKLIEIIKKNS